ncbi:MAG: ELM1/GtrOC1 family putative glycosyltransferase [Pseudomonadota bacterium]
MHDARAGNKNQVDALAFAMCCVFDDLFKKKYIAETTQYVSLYNPSNRFTAAFKNKKLIAEQNQKRPDIAIGCGRKSAWSVAQMSMRNVFTIQILRPPCSIKKFNHVIIPQHDLINGANVIKTIGALNKINVSMLNNIKQKHAHFFANYPKPHIGVLIGGATRHFKLDRDWLLSLLSSLEKTASKYNGSLFICAAPRSQPQLLQTILSYKDRHFVWTNGANNPYLPILASADCLIVSGESVNMLSEACATQKPVWISIPKNHNPRSKLLRFHHVLVEQNIANYVHDDIEIKAHDRPITPSTDQIDDETTQVAQKLCQSYIDYIAQK